VTPEQAARIDAALRVVSARLDERVAAGELSRVEAAELLAHELDLLLAAGGE